MNPKFRTFAHWLALLTGTLLLWSVFSLSLPTYAADNQTVEIKQWIFHRFSLILSPYSCHDGIAGCYANPDYHVPSWLMSQAYIPIEQSWSSPALTFWSKHYSRRRIDFCYVEVQKEGSSRWDRIKVIGGSRDWVQMTLDLSAYRGEKIRVKFFCEPNPAAEEGRKLNRFNKQILYIQDVQIIANAPAP
jgi:hypothetical protein